MPQIVIRTKRFKLLQDVLFIKNETAEPIRTYIVSTMQHRKDNIYLVAGIGHAVNENQLTPIKQHNETKN